MNPDDNQTVNPADYLDQIAPKPSSGAKFLKQRPLVIGGLILFLVVILALFGIVTVNMSSNKKPSELLATKLLATEDIASQADKNIKSTKLMATNSNLKINLTNAVRDINPLLANEGVDVKKVNSKVIDAENKEILIRLDDARLNVKYDTSYAGEMATQLKDILILMNQVYKSTHSNKFKSILNDSYKNLEPIQKQFADFN